MARIRVKDPSIEHINLPRSGKNISLTTISHDEYYNLIKDYSLITSIEFFNRYFNTVTKSNFNWIELPKEDLILICRKAIEKEAIRREFNVKASNSHQEICEMFLEALIGISLVKFKSIKPQLLNSLTKMCDNKLETIKYLIRENRSYEKKNYQSSSPDKTKEIRAKRFQKNKFYLAGYKNYFEEIKEQPNEWLLNEALRPGYFERQSSHIINLNAYDPQFLDFPYRFIGFITIQDLNSLYNDWEEGKNILEDIYSLVFNASFHNYLENLIQKHDFSLKRQHLIIEAYESMRKELYAAAVCLLLSQIEGLLWDFADYIDRTMFPIADRSRQNPIYYCQFYKYDEDGYYYCNGKKFKIYELIKKNDRSKLDIVKNKKNKPIYFKGIRQLLQKTVLAHIMYVELFEHLAGELFQERNKILHGHDLNFGTKENATNKLLALTALLHTFKK